MTSSQELKAPKEIGQDVLPSNPTTRQPRKLRIHITGGIKDVDLLMRRISKTLNEHEFIGVHWVPDFNNLERFGELGPLHKGSLGFSEVTDQ